MVNYNKSSIYKLCCKDVNIKEEYVGSTTRFERRKAEHKSTCCNENNRSYNFYVYQFIRENGGMDNWDMIQIEEVNVNSKRELDTRERYWIEFLKAKLNCQIPTQTNKEYKEKNKEVILEKAKEYYEKNREVILDKDKIYRENNKEVILDRDKIYRENNREVIAEKNKKYYENNKEVIAEKTKEYREIEKAKGKIKCECGSEITFLSIFKHKKTKKHLKFIDQSREQI